MQLKNKLKKAYKKKLVNAHPDRGGDADTFYLLQKNYKYLMNEEDPEDDDNTTIDNGNDVTIKPSPRFRIVLLSRDLQEPRLEELQNACTNIWLSKAKIIYKNSKTPIVFSYKGRSEWLAKVEAKRVAAEWGQRKFMSNRKFEDDEREIPHVKNMIIERVVMRQHRLRSVLFYGYVCNHLSCKNEKYNKQMVENWSHYVLPPSLRKQETLKDNDIDIYIKTEMQKCYSILNDMKTFENETTTFKTDQNEMP